jgi:hypothetical protein
LCVVLAFPLLVPTYEPQKEDRDRERRNDADPDQSRSKVPPQPAGKSEIASSAIGNQVIADKPLEPGEPDALGLNKIAAGLSFFLRNQKTKPPLAIAINGRWGSGKTSLMNLLKSNLEDWGAHPVWFNAWHHQNEEQMLAALLQAVKDQAVPPLWEVAGLWFRVRLSLIRLKRRWFRLLLIAAGLFLLYRLGEFLTKPPFYLSVAEIIKTLLNKDSVSTAGWLKGKPIVAPIATVLAILKILSSTLTAFGSKPGDLLKSVSGGAKSRDLDAQTSFRQRFASEFKDVTSSLGPNRRMLILIDDLDRCQPEKVREVLEGVNFLSSSGDCFIVLGMARDIVEHCVGLSFKDVVDSMSWQAMGLTPADIERALRDAELAEQRKADPVPPAQNGAKGKPDVESPAKRRAFAHLYLDKLIQIEVSVPEPTPNQLRLLFRTDQEWQKDQDQREKKVQSVMKGARLVYNVSRPLFGASIAALVLVSAWTVIRPPVQTWAIREFTPSPSEPTFTAPTDGNAGNSASKPPVTGTDGATSPKPNGKSGGKKIAPEPIVSVVESAPRVSPAIEVNADDDMWPSSWKTSWPFGLVILAGLAAVIASLKRLPQRIISDNVVFTNALAIWHPLVMSGGAKNTPRTARRFQNRVRYLAMRQRALVDGEVLSLGERLARAGLRAPARLAAPPMHLQESPDLSPKLVEEAEDVRNLIEAGRSGKTSVWNVELKPEGMVASPLGESSLTKEMLFALVQSNIYIPEPMLVALAAIEEFEPEWIHDEDLFQSKVVDTVSVKTPAQAAIFNETLAGHRKHWDNWHNLRYYRRAYIALCSEISRQERAKSKS